MTTLRVSRRQRGFALSLPLSVGLLVLLALVAMAQLMRSGQTLEEAAWDAGGAAAEEAAVSAVEEASWRLQRALTDPAEPLYWHLRRELVRGHRPYLDISTDVDPKLLRERLADPAQPPLFRSMRIDHFRVVFHVPPSTPRPAGAVQIPGPTPGAPGQATSSGSAGRPGEQLVDFDCGISLDLASHRVYRRACERRRYGVVHVSPPKPFDQMTLAIADHGFLRELPRIRNRWRRLLLGARSLVERVDWMRNVLTNSMPGRPPPRGTPLSGTTDTGNGAVEISFAPPFQFARKPPRMPPALSRLLPELMDERKRSEPSVEDTLSKMTPEERGWEDWRMVMIRPEAQLRFRVAAPEPSRDREAWPQTDVGMVGTDAPGPDAVVFSLQPNVDLAEFDYEVRLRELEREHEPALQKAMEEVNELWVGYLERSPLTLSAGMFTKLETDLLALYKKMHPPFVKICTGLKELVAHAGRHTRSGLTGSALDAYYQRASKRLRAFGLHVADQEQLDAALKNYPVFNGHLSLSGQKPVTLDARAFSGKALISVRAERGLVPEKLTVSALRRARPGSDLAVVDAPLIHLGQEAVEAGLVVGDRLSIAGTPEITGNLFMKRLAPLADRRPDEELKGKITYDPLLTSGALLERKTTAQEPENFALDHLVVTICPRGTDRVVRRAPPAGEGG